MDPISAKSGLVCDPGPMWTAEREANLRAQAFSWLAVRTHDGLSALKTEEIRGFTFEGKSFALMDRQRGIRKPAELDITAGENGDC